MKESLKTAINKLNDLEKKVSLCEQDKYFISENHKNILFKDIHYEIKKCLRKIFGKSNDGNNYAFFDDIFKTSLSGHNKGVMFSYWSFEGIPYNSSKDVDGKWRGNLFYKGSRFSDKRLYDNFYNIFNVISNFCKDKDFKNDSNAPVDFFVRNHIKSIKPQETTNNDEPIIFIPDIEEAKDIKGIKIPVKKKFTDANYYEIRELKVLLEKIYELKSKSDPANSHEQRFALKEQIKQVLSENLNKAFDKLSVIKDSILFDFASILKQYFSHIDSTNIKCLKEVFYLLVCYQFYDHDGITCLYIPKDHESKSCLGILVPFDKFTEIKKNHSTFFDITNNLSKLPIIEERIFKAVKQDIYLKNIWKAHYLAQKPLYESLCLHFKILLNHICRTKEIKTLDISYRIKEFDSFYNRVVDRFNDPEKFKIPPEEIEEFRRCFIAADADNANKVFSRFWDISGLRVLCVFKSDLDKVYYELCPDQCPTGIKDISNPFINDKYFIKVNYYDKKSDNDYRAEHYILRLGSTREMHPELIDLRDLKCELQVKTTLSQGWSDADHDLFYKSELPPSQLQELLPESNKKIGQKRAMASRKLDEVDEEFIKFKDTIKEILDEY